MAKQGRPSKFSDKIQEAVKLMARRGFTDKEMAVCLSVTEQTFNNWKKAHPLFFESLKDWKAEADHKVERSLFERATGWACPDTKAQWVQDENGGRWEYAELEKHYPGDTTAQIFWLKNRQPDKWRDKVDYEHSGSVNANLSELTKEDLLKIASGK